tara:strand:- start:552 stop:836 length:285 start_codon:yes stop_codon:yes gene_type:complete
MKRIFLIITSIFLLSGCAQYSSLVGPGITIATTGNITKASASLAASNTLKTSELVSENAKVRECRTIHTAELNEIFFRTLDEFDCIRDDFSILR